jgi:ATP-dependent metalloprotease
VAATSEMWPSMSNAIAAPLRVFGQRVQTTPHSSLGRKEDRQVPQPSPSPVDSVNV